MVLLEYVNKHEKHHHSWNVSALTIVIVGELTLLEIQFLMINEGNNNIEQDQ
jgi:hypothetical protein